MIDESLFGKVIYMMGGQEAQIVKGYTRPNLGECYLVNEDYPTPPPENGFGLSIYPIDRMEILLSRQKEYKEVYKSNKRFQEEQERKKREAAEAKAKREDLFGFDKGKTAYQKGRILKILMKQFRYSDYEGDGNGGFRKCNQRILTRRDYLIEQIKNGSYVDKKVIQGKLIYRLNHPKHNNEPETFSEITKTEYDFANYLVDNGILQTI